MSARRRRQGGLLRGAAGARLGRGGRPVHDGSQDDDPPPARQARRPARHRDRPRGRLPHRRCVMDPLRRVMTWSRLPRRTLRLQLTLLYGGVLVALLVAVLGVWGLLYGTSSKAAPGSPVSAVVDAQAQAAGNSHHVDILFALVLAVAVVLALGLGWLIAGRLLRALRTITATAKDISASNLHKRLNIEGPDDELKELGGTLDDLFARLEASFESQRRFVANASHELRTPLTAERSLLQVTLDDPQASVT